MKTRFMSGVASQNLGTSVYSFCTGTRVYLSATEDMEPAAERHGQASCEFLAWLQEFVYTGSWRLLSEQASWPCQVV